MHAPAAPKPIDPDLLMLAYRSGIFPMADSRDDPDIFWVEPRKRAIIPLDRFHCSRSLARTLRRGRFRVSCNEAFERVIAACAGPRRSKDDGENGEGWISQRIARSYVLLHRLGHAHSIECWQEDRLVGGLYGVGFDRVFCGESMFSLVPDASKVALAWLVASMKRAGMTLLDCQFLTEHLASMGAVEIGQKRYLTLLKAAQRPYSLVAAPVSSAAGRRLGEGLGRGEGVSDGEALGEGEALALPEGFGALATAAGGSSSSPGNFIAQSFTHTS